MSSISTNPLADASPLCRLNVQTMTARYAAASLSPLEVADAALARASAVQDRYNAFASIDRAGALAAAAAADERWRRGRPLSPIDGVPVTIKDIVQVQGWSVRYGSHSSSAAVCDSDAPSVARLRAAGAVLLGMTTTPEFGWKAVTDNPLHGITRNPWRPELTPGGSSGGAAVAAAAGAGVLHLGTDGGGSIRIPAAFCGLVGHKPSFGRVPAYPGSAFGTLAHLGPIARCVGDVSAMLDAMSGRDLRDWHQPIGNPPAFPPLALSRARVAYWSTPACGQLRPEVAAVMEQALSLLRSLGMEIQPFELPDIDLLDVFQKHWFSGAANRLSRVAPALRGQLDPGFVEIAERGLALSAADLVAAQARRAEFGAFMDQTMSRFDLLLAPATPLAAFPIASRQPAGDGAAWTEWAGFSFPLNLSQHPACVVPCGLTPDGRPLGLQFIGARGADRQLLSLAGQFEALGAFPHLLDSGADDER